ncbi:hypothetical protein [Lactococcus lactis]|uniref:hypothetical protein n=1 Tax=Lactococcus lactis TaxID=1358 RepID=UPI0020741218|nr:hypothetical protein [Lactococcus lactis]
MNAQNFINGYLEGTKIFDAKEYYSLLEEYKSKSPREEIPLHLYTINYIDKYRFDKQISENGKINIFNDATEEIIKFDVLKYLEDRNPFFRGCGRENFDIVYQEDKHIQIILEKISSDYVINSLKVFDDVKKGYSYLVVKKLYNYWAKSMNIFAAVYNEVDGNEILFEHIITNYIHDFHLEWDNFATEDNDPSYNYFETIFENIALDFCNTYQNKYNGGIISEELVNDFLNFYISKTSHIMAEAGSEILINDSKENMERNIKFSSSIISNILEKILKTFFQKVLDEQRKLFKTYAQNHFSNTLMRGIIDIIEGKIVVASLNAWEILGHRSLDKYLEVEKSSNNILHLENLYIGQSQGVENKLNVLDRLKQHSKFQEALAFCPKNKEVALLFLFSTSNQFFFLPPGGKNGKSKMEEFLNFKNEFPSSELINLCEIALINFFKPCKNVQHVKGDFQHISTNKFDSIHKKYDGLIIELDCDNYKLEITTDHRTLTLSQVFRVTNVEF